MRGVLGVIEGLGATSLRLVEHLGALASFAGSVAGYALRPPYRWMLFLRELYKLGVLSVVIVGVSALAVGLVLGLLGYEILVDFGSTGSLGAFVGLALLRELGPVLTALLVTGRAGSATTAEIGTMVATQQLDGLRMMSVSPLDYVVVPRALAMIAVMPLLTALFDVIGIGGGYLLGVQVMGVDAGRFMSSLEGAATFSNDVMGSLVKGLVFGVIVALVSTYRGVTCRPTSAGVSAATTATVVVSSVSILVFDFFITALWEF